MIASSATMSTDFATGPLVYNIFESCVVGSEDWIGRN